MGSAGRASALPPWIDTEIALRHFGYAVQPRKAEPFFPVRRRMGLPHSSQICPSSSLGSTGSSSVSGMSTVQVHSG